MFNKEGIPFFIIIIPFLSIVFISFFTVSYYLKLSEQNFKADMQEYQLLYNQNQKSSLEKFTIFKEKKQKQLEERQGEFTYFIYILTGAILVFMALFTILMVTVINDIVKKYINQVEHEQQKLHELNANLANKVKAGIEEGKRKDKAILQQSKLARMGSMISMIAHQWRQPLSELSGVLMELETATRFKKVDDKHILNSIERSDKMIEFMSNTIDDFRNFYKPDKVKEDFSILDSCKKALNLINASLSNEEIELKVLNKKDSMVYGYPTEYSQVILNIITNARDILLEKNVQDPRIELTIDSSHGNSIVTIKDNAGGIKDEHFDELFDPYFSTKDSSKGTGLGLYISKIIIEKNMGGELAVYNDDEGAVFTITLRQKI